MYVNIFLFLPIILTLNMLLFYFVYKTKLKKSDLDLKNILDKTNMPICIRNEHLATIYFNSAYAIMLPTDENILVDSLYYIDQNEYTELKKTLLSTKIETSEKSIVIDGKRKVFECTHQYIPETSCILSLAYDLTQKTSTIEAMLLNKSTYKELLNNMNTAVAIFNSERLLEYYNQSFVILWKLSTKYLEKLPKYEEILSKLHAEGKTTQYTNFKDYKDERIKMFKNLRHVQTDFLYLPDSRVIKMMIIPRAIGGLLFCFEDLTDQYTLQSSYNSLFSVHKATLENIQESICVFGLDGNLTLFNTNFHLLWGLELDYLKSSPNIYNLLSKSNYKFLMQESSMLINNKLIAQCSATARKTEAIIPLIDNKFIKRVVAPLPGGSIMITDLDITEAYLSEKHLLAKSQNLQDADQIKTEFLSNISYELRSPLTSIIGFAELLRLKFKKDHNINEEYITNILEASKKLEDLINDILSIIKIESGLIEIDKKLCNLSEIIKSIIEEHKHLMLAKNISVSLQLNEHSMIFSDQEKTSEIINKLIINAIQHSPKNQNIYIHTYSKDTNLMFQIANQGHAVSLDDQNLIFSKFYQSSNVKTEGRSGLGLGLTIVKKLIELHSGKIEYASSPEYSNIFTCQFPTIIL